MSNVNYYTTLVPSFTGMGLFRIQIQDSPTKEFHKKVRRRWWRKYAFYH